MKLDWLESYAVFTESLNFTRAAQELHISQPALHVQIRKLGEALGVRLYRKRGRQLVLTGDGERVARFARELGGRIEEFQDELRVGTGTGPAVLSAGRGAYLDLLEAPIRAYLAQGRPLLLLTGDAEATVEALSAGRAHLGVAAMDLVPEGLRAAPLVEVGQVLVVPRGHSLEGREHLRLRELDGVPLILPPADRRHRQTVERGIRQAGGRCQVAVEAGGWDLMLQFVRFGLGLSIVNASCRLGEDLRGIELPELPTIQYWLLTLARGHLPRHAQALWRHLSALVPRSASSSC